MADNDVTLKGAELIKQWMGSVEMVARAKQQLNRAECDQANATTALGKWMTPDDWKPGEKFCLWYGDSLIEVSPVERSGNGTYEIIVRTRGKSLLRVA